MFGTCLLANKKNRKKFKGLKEELWKKEPLCELCHRWIRRLEDASLDHIIPLGAGGPDERSNLQLTHQLCNEIKGCRPFKRLPRKLIPNFKDLSRLRPTTKLTDK